MSKDFATRLKRIREDRQYSQTKLAEVTGIPLSTIRKYEQNITTEPKALYLLELAKALDITPEYLMIGDNNMTSYTNAIKYELMQINEYSIITQIKETELNSTVLAHLEMGEELVKDIRDKWNEGGVFKKEVNGVLEESRCTKNYVQEVILRYCQNRTLFKKKFNLQDGMINEN